MSNNIKRVTKNALFLYIRTGVSLIIQLIAVRYLLLYLGSEDYGLYGLIGSIVALVESFKGLLSTSLQRFINIERGKQCIGRINEIFNVGYRLYCHIGIVLTFLVIIVGCFSIPYLDIPQLLVIQAYFVLVISAFTMGIGIAIIPYDALIVAYEKFDAFAVLSIIGSVLKLGIVLLLVVFPVWRVTIYAISLLAVTSFTRMLLCVYCKKTFKEIAIIKKYEDSTYKRRVISLAGFRILGSVGQTIQSTGVSYILNIFGGLIINAARAISGQVLSAVNVMVWSISIGFNPRCLTLWGEGKKDEFFRLLFIQSKLCYIINSTLGFCISIFAYPILKLWLGSVPEYTEVFVQTIILYAILKNFQDAIDTYFNAIGKVKSIQITIFVLNLLSLVIIWLLLKLSFDYYWAMLVMAFIEFVIVMCSLFIAYHIGGFPVYNYFRHVLLRCLFSIVSLTLLFLTINSTFKATDNILSLFLKFASLLAITFISTVFIVFSKNERKSLFEMYRRFIVKKFHVKNH